ncbi:MAG: methyltransferase domain-containing protein, partial [Thermoanaerobaculia bacterium]
GLILAAGVAALAVPLLRAPVISALAPAGLRAGALLSSFALFGPCLFLLGCVSPFVVRLAAPGLERLGRTVGLFYALSTAGSFVGTVATGFFLIAWLGVRGIFLLTGGLLVGIAVLWFALLRGRPAALALLVVPWLVPGGEPFTARVLSNGTRVERVHRANGFYADLQVLDYTGAAYRTRELVLDGLVQSGVDRDSGLSVYEYAYFLEHLAWGMRPDGRTCLVIGLGAGVVPRWFEERGAVCDVVDINPDVVTAARNHFGFSPRGEVVLADARRFLAESDERYDYVVLDVFTGDTTPGHLLTLEAMRQLEAHVAPGGLLVANLIGALGDEGRMTAAIARTASRVFDTVRVFPNFEVRDGAGFGNLTLVAHDGAPLAFVPSRVAAFPVHPLARGDVARFLGREHVLAADPDAILLTDDYNPIDFFDRRVKERLRRNVLRGIEWEALL